MDLSLKADWTGFYREGPKGNDTKVVVRKVNAGLHYFQFWI